MARSMTATGDIHVSRFVMLDTGADYSIKECGAGRRIYGVSQMGARANALLDSSDPPLAATSGEQLQVFRDQCVVEYGGTITRGDFLMSDASGKAVKATDDADTLEGTVSAGIDVGARALESGTSGTLGYVELTPFQT